MEPMPVTTMHHLMTYAVPLSVCLIGLAVWFFAVPIHLLNHPASAMKARRHDLHHCHGVREALQMSRDAGLLLVIALATGLHRDWPEDFGADLKRFFLIRICSLLAWHRYFADIVEHEHTVLCASVSTQVDFMRHDDQLQAELLGLRKVCV
jgi:hypothetical protein